MVRYTIIIISILAFLAGGAFAERVDISEDLKNNVQTKQSVPFQQGTTPGANQNSVSPSDSELMTDIIDIKPLEKIGYDKRIIKYGLLIISIILLFCLIIYLIDYFIRRRKNNINEEVFYIPADAEALILLEDLKKESGLDAREFYFRLTAILRGYIGKRFDIDAPEMTTEELLPKLNELDCDKKLIIDIKSVLTSTEPVKYAGADAVNEKMESDFQIVKDFIRLTPKIEADSEGETKDV